MRKSITTENQLHKYIYIYTKINTIPNIHKIQNTNYKNSTKNNQQMIPKITNTHSNAQKTNIIYTIHIIT